MLHRYLLVIQMFLINVFSWFSSFVKSMAFRKMSSDPLDVSTVSDLQSDVSQSVTDDTSWQEKTDDSSDTLSSKETSSSPTESYSIEWKKLEEQLHGICTSVARLKNLGTPEETKIIAEMAETTMDQMKRLKNAVEQIGLPNLKCIKTTCSECDASASENKLKVSELKEQVIRLEAQMSAKRELIGNLKSVLECNKASSEVAMSNIKSRYENEKTIVKETMLKLKKELRKLKDSLVTFSSMHAMLSARCDDYAIRENELKRKLAVSEENRNSLNQLLLLSIQQQSCLKMQLDEALAARGGG